ncbi:MAG: DUF4332 domain-containing protein, partial [Deltaproteobacteria bacterium]|nr:DUF4332 domain-containing protein [Deltaproteobacteria bacterium]
MGRKRNIHGILGLFILVFSEILMFKGAEPFASWFYYFAWWSYILIVDSIIYKIKKNSLIMNRTGEFFLMLFWSVFIWTFFEAINLIMKNWYYVNVVPICVVRWLGYGVAYATVLPGLFETTELLESLGLFKNSSVKPISVNKLWTISSLVLGIACFFGVFFYPKFCFPLIWGSFVFLLEPINYRWGGKSILRDWANGSLRKFYLLLTAGCICGILWEFWNFWATTKWIYTVPFLEELKLFEMPLVGFLGFPPFTVECYVMYNFISLFRHQRGWEEDNYRLSPGKKVNLFLLLGGALFGLCFCLYTFKAMDEKTVNSYWPDLKELQTISPETAMSLTSLGIRTPKALLAKTKSEQGKKYLTLKLNVTENEIAKWISLAKLTKLKGMGTLNANLLNKAGIGNIPDLAKQNPAMLYEKLLALEKNDPQEGIPIPRQAIIRVWVREARRIVRDHKQL